MFTSRKILAAGVALIATAALTGCGGGGNPLEDPTGDSEVDQSKIVIGSQTYYSNEIVAEIYAQALENAGFEVDRQFNAGQRDAYMPDVESGAITLFPEYTGNLLEYLDPEATATSSDDVYAALQKALPEGLTALDYAEASDQDTYTVLKSFAEEHGLTTIADLSKLKTQPVLGGAPELQERPYGPAGANKVYGVDIGFSATADATLDALLQGQVQVADIYTASPAFQTEEIVALEDPESMILASNVVPIVSKGTAPSISEVINKVSAALSAEDLVNMNVQSTVDKLSTPDIATEWLKEKGLN